MSQEKKKRQLKALYAFQGGRCHWCKVGMIPTVLYTPTRGAKPPLRLCTLDHLDDRLSSERGKRPGEYRRVAACWQCNHERGKQSEAAQPIERLRQLSGRLGRAAVDACREMEGRNAQTIQTVTAETAGE